MAQPAGGRRSRLIGESLFRTIDDGLTQLGWKESPALNYPLNVVAEAVDDDTEVPLNTLAVAAEDVSGDEAELGFFAESLWVARHVAGDVRDIVRGRFPDIGRAHPTIDVYDWEQATPTLVFTCAVERVVEDAAHGFTTPARRFWRTVRIELADDNWEEG
jgi:hypothetical protein